METVVALLMFVNFEIKEHRIQDSMGMCLRGKREAERQYSETVSYKCVKTNLGYFLVTKSIITHILDNVRVMNS